MLEPFVKLYYKEKYLIISTEKLGREHFLSTPVILNHMYASKTN